MSTTKLTVKETVEKLNTIDSPNDPFFINCLTDERKGVQACIQKLKKKFEEEEQEQQRLIKLTQYEREARGKGYQFIAGIDEVGRGPLAGPVVAAAVILPNHFTLKGVNDSKQLSKQKREVLYNDIMNNALAVGIGIVHANEIDTLNIYQATKKAMLQAINKLPINPDFLLLDAMELDTMIPQKSLIKGDTLSISIACSSIIAKVYRDQLMEEYSKQFPPYQFHKNSGYGTKEHLDALKQFGPCPIHRKSFAPIKELLQLEFDL